jgi:hypothetical protein
MGEFHFILDVPSCSYQTIKNSFYIGTLLHGNDAKLVFFVYPNQECLCIVVKNTSATWPVSVQTASLKETIALPKLFVLLEMGYLT